MAGGWSQERIRATINQTYIEKELGSRRHQDTLHRVLAFGDGLTDDTYLDWILERSPRFFLILNDIGVPEKIFEVIDRSFDDDDLPLSQDALWELNLFGTTSETLDKKFHRQQFHFLIQELEPGGHVDYGGWEVVPVECVAKKTGIQPTGSSTDRVLAQDQLYTRKRIPSSSDHGIDRIRFIMHLKNIAAIQHRHLVTVWATYSQNDYNFVMLTPSCDVTLKHVLEDKETAKHFKCLEKHERRQTLLTWVHCLVSGLAYLHSRGFMHKAIRPSSILIDRDNNIYLSDYHPLRVLDVDESPNPYSGEMYEFAPPENWQRKPCLHETAPLKTVLPGGGRTSRRLPKTDSAGTEERRPSIPGLSGLGFEPVSRTASRSQNSSSGSSTTHKPRNALITTFAPPDTTPASLPHKYFPGDVFSLTSVILTVLSYLLGHSPKSFASHRSRLNRQAGRGNAPPDASFHKNLKQVEKWIDTLAKEAGQKEKKDQKLWGSVVELVNLCKFGVKKEPEDRPLSGDLEKQMIGWIEWGIGKRRKCTCSEADRKSIEPEKPNRILMAQRDSIMSWSKISERLSEAPDGDYFPPTPAIRPRRSLSARLSLDRAPELRRSRATRPPSSLLNGQISSLGSMDEEEESVRPPSRRQSDIIRTAVKQAVASTASPPHVRKPSLSDGNPTVVHQGRSAYRIKPKKAHSSSSFSRPHQGSIQEEGPNDFQASPSSKHSSSDFPRSTSSKHSSGDVPGRRIVAPTPLDPDAESSYVLKPRKGSAPPSINLARSFPRPPPIEQVHNHANSHFPETPPEAEDIDPLDRTSAVATNGNSTRSPSIIATGKNASYLHGIPPPAEGEGDLDDDDAKTLGRASIVTESEVWGLGNALERDESDTLAEQEEEASDPDEDVIIPNPLRVNSGNAKLDRFRGPSAAAMSRPKISGTGSGAGGVGMIYKPRTSSAKIGRGGDARPTANGSARGINGFRYSKGTHGMDMELKDRRDWPLPLGTLTFDRGGGAVRG